MLIILRECWKVEHTPRTQIVNNFLESSQAPTGITSLALNGVLQGPGAVVVAVETLTYLDNATVRDIVSLCRAFNDVAAQLDQSIEEFCEQRNLRK
jgi:hypothetical protein